MMQKSAPEHGALFDLSTRTKLRVAGADRLRFLNGQVSNDLRKASAANAIHACVLSAKGRINADVFICVDGDSFLIDAEAELREQLAARLERYVIADDVRISDVTDEFALFHVIGPGEAALTEGGRAVLADRFGVAGTDAWLPRARHGLTLQELSAALPFCDEDRAEIYRIERGIPRWGRELSDEIIPTEANLEMSAIDYEKGCYIGQEVISRMKMSGQTNKRLCGLVAVGDDPLKAGMRVMSSVSEMKDVGWITSATTSVRIGRQIALGFVKRGFNEVGRRLFARVADSTVADEVVPLEIVHLPFG